MSSETPGQTQAPATTVPKPASGPAGGPPATPSAPAVKPETAAAAPTVSKSPPATAVPAPPAAPVVWPNPLSHLTVPFQGADFSFRGYHAEATVTPDKVLWAAQEMDREGFALDTITGVDWLAAGQFEVVYDYFHLQKPLRAVIRTRVPRENPEVLTISSIYPGANWHERETHDFFGITFAGHPDLTPFLLPEDATYHPLRKDFSA